MRLRRLAFLAAALVLGVLYAAAARGLPDFGGYRGPYGDFVNRVVVPERHVTDAVTAVNFDIRGFDTVGEEFILFVSVIGALVLLRKADEENESEGEPAKDACRDREVPGPSDAIRIWTLALVGPSVLFGAYVVTHGQLTPGGGFQGGVILATVPLLVYLGGNVKAFQRIATHKLVETGEGLGAAVFVLIGLLPLFWGLSFLSNSLWLGQPGDAFSGGTIPLISAATGLEVAGGFVLLLSAFLRDTLKEKD